jgi:hypothetical protein
MDENAWSLAHLCLPVTFRGVKKRMIPFKYFAIRFNVVILVYVTNYRTD